MHADSQRMVPRVVTANTTLEVWGGSSDDFLLCPGSRLVLNGGVYDGAIKAAVSGAGTVLVRGNVTLGQVGEPGRAVGDITIN
ncbi:hypothetical protein GPECTOR_8g381 [Gonium pectorale]|uniref:Uncharacterized protein n=1 Tax=Gonium pectorale TaxID=33097 RepID=A0A150GT73_GONPE|nr:hypothetical protein GPECTOR_8g381 [Gonium pectorale]|eukprot:KXZ53013.1 hypothetical protein GPECTOR_8g381 [Gonium pectorale]